MGLATGPDSAQAAELSVAAAPSPRVLPLSRAIAMWHASMPALMRSTALSNLRKLAASGEVLSIGTVFSGSDIALVSLEKLCSYWQSCFGLTIPWCSVFACEKDQQKQHFLRTQAHGVSTIFSDASQLSHQKAHNLFK